MSSGFTGCTHYHQFRNSHNKTDDNSWKEILSPHIWVPDTTDSYLDKAWKCSFPVKTMRKSKNVWHDHKKEVEGGKTAM